MSENNFLGGFGNNNYHYIDNEKFYLMGEGLFIYPKNYADNQKVTIHLKTQVKQNCYNIKPYLFKDKIVTNFVKLNDLVILGNKNLYKNDPIENTKLIVWSDDKNIGDRINTVTGKILKEQKEFWQDTNLEQIAIFIPTPYLTKQNCYNARLMNKTILAFINPLTIDDIDLHNLVAHENLHFWFGSCCALIKGPDWFSEGFSDYYRDKIKYHYTKNKRNFIDDYNKKLKQYFISPFYKLSNNWFDNHNFNYTAIGKLPYLKGYLIAGQIDSIIDLDDTIRNMVKTCRIDKTNCYFSPEFLFKHTHKINEIKKEQINQIINKLTLDNINKSFLDFAQLNSRRIQSIQYDLDISNLIEDGMIDGNYLNKIDNKYDKNKFYKLSNIRWGYDNDLHFYLDNNGVQEEFIPKSIDNPITIPYYILNSEQGG